MAVFLQVSALDLPVKRVNNKDYYYYTVERNESLADITHKFGISREDVLRTNPAATDGLRRGMTLYFPVDEFTEDDDRLPGKSSETNGSNGPTRYKVVKGETLYGISMRFGVKPDAIIALNPSAASGVKAGQILLIPQQGTEIDMQTDNLNENVTVPVVIQHEDTQPKTDEHFDNKAVQETTPNIEEENNRQSDVEEEIALSDESEEIGDDSVSEESQALISLLLPLMLNDNEENRQAKMTADFVRGFMLGVKTLSEESYPCEINIYDTKGDVDQIRKLLKDSAVIASSIIISHEEGPAGELMPSFATKNGNYILNLFASHDSTYLTNPYFLQANIPASLMYEKAADALMNVYEDYIPVFLVAKGGKGEKLPFTSYLTERYKEKGIQPIELMYEGMLTSVDVDNIDLSANYVFIPASGALSEFNKFAHTLMTLRENTDNPSSIALFGYPDWLTFRGEALESLHRLGAMIYSRFFCEENNDEIISFNKEFEATYGKRPLEQVPSQALLGYDSARFLLSNLSENEGEFSALSLRPFRGIQSTFMFEEATNPDDNVEEDNTPGGYMNTSLYIITYMPGNRTSVRVL